MYGTDGGAQYLGQMEGQKNAYVYRPMFGNPGIHGGPLAAPMYRHILHRSFCIDTVKQRLYFGVTCGLGWSAMKKIIFLPLTIPT